MHPKESADVEPEQASFVLFLQKREKRLFASEDGMSIQAELLLHPLRREVWNLILAPQSDSASPRRYDRGQAREASLSHFTPCSLVPFHLIVFTTGRITRFTSASAASRSGEKLPCSG